MALSDPISISADSPTPALTLSRLSTGPGMAAMYEDVTNGYTLNINHTQNSQTGERHYMKLQQKVSATNPLTGGTSYQLANVSISASFPAYGWTAAQKDALVKALVTDIMASITITKFDSFQS